MCSLEKLHNSLLYIFLHHYSKRLIGKWDLGSFNFKICEVWGCWNPNGVILGNEVEVGLFMLLSDQFADCAKIIKIVLIV